MGERSRDDDDDDDHEAYAVDARAGDASARYAARVALGLAVLASVTWVLVLGGLTSSAPLRVAVTVRDPALPLPLTGANGSWFLHRDLAVCERAARSPAVHVDDTSDTAASAGSGSAFHAAVAHGTRLRSGMLPYCARAPLSERFACALMTYRDHVQLPARREARRRAARAAGQAPTAPLQHKWVVFQVVDHFGSNGGFADRQYGLVMSFMLATLLERAFGLDYAVPAPLSATLEPVPLLHRTPIAVLRPEPEAVVPAGAVPFVDPLTHHRYVLHADGRTVTRTTRLLDPTGADAALVRSLAAPAWGLFNASNGDGARRWVRFADGATFGAAGSPPLPAHMDVAPAEYARRNAAMDALQARVHTAALAAGDEDDRRVVLPWSDDHAIPAALEATDFLGRGLGRSGTYTDPIAGTTFKVYDWVGMPHPLSGLAAAAGAADPHDVLVFRGNHNFYLDLGQQPAFVEAWARAGFGGVGGGVNLDSAYSCLYGFLFQPTLPVQLMLYNDGIIEPSPLLLAATAAEVDRARAAGLPPPPLPRAHHAPTLVCAQLRMGAGPQSAGNGSGEASFHDSHVFNTADTLTVVWDALKVYVDAKLPGAYPAAALPPDATVDDAVARARLDPSVDAPFALFVASDSDDVIARGRRAWATYLRPGDAAPHPASDAASDERWYRTVRGPIVHLDRIGEDRDTALSDPNASAAQRDALVRGFRKVVADNYALGECEYAVISNSGFGRTGVWRTRLPHANVRVLSEGALHPLDGRFQFNAP